MLFLDRRDVAALLPMADRIGDLHAELGQLVTGARPGRSTAGQIFVFDSTGTALQDVAAAAAV